MSQPRIVQVIEMDLQNQKPLLVLDSEGYIWRYAFVAGGRRQWQMIDVPMFPKPESAYVIEM